MGMPTLLDIAIQNGSDAVAGLIDESTKAHPEIKIGFARTIKGLFYKTLVRRANPTVGFRSANNGTVVSKGVYENRRYECFIMNPRWECDKVVADSDEDGAPVYIANEASGMMEGAMQTLASQFYYGTGNDVLGFAGLLAAYDSTNMVIDAAGTTDATASSVWAVKFGPKDVAWLYGNNGSLNMSEVTEQRILGVDGNPLTAYVQEMVARPGLQVANIRNLGRIKKLTNDSGKGLTDTLLSELLALFQVGAIPDCFLMTRRSLDQLRRSRTATNPTGSPAPIPTEAFGIPIWPTDAITNTETLAS